MATLSRPLGSPPFLAGFLNLGGELIPVARLDRLYGLSEHAVTPRTPLIVLRTPAAPLALLVEEVLDVETGSSPGDGPAAGGTRRIGGLLVEVLVPEDLLHTAEGERLAHLRRREERRLEELARGAEAEA